VAATEVATAEVINIIADTLQRLYRDEYGMELDRLNAVDRARFVATTIKYGDGAESGTRVVEGKYDPPLCTKCNEAG
jgi:hypothetical protein